VYRAATRPRPLQQVYRGARCIERRQDHHHRGPIRPPLARASTLCRIKTNFVNLTHQADLQVNGKTIESMQPFVNVAPHLQLLSEMSVNDSASIGHSLGFFPTLDHTKSMKYNGQYTTLNASSGNGFANNRPYAGVGDNQTLQNTTGGNAAGQCY